MGLDSSIISSAAVWEASGHLAGFSDPMVDCRKSNQRYRADQVFWAKLETTEGEEVCYVTVLESDNMISEATKIAYAIAKKKNITGPFRELVLQDLMSVPAEAYSKIPSPATGDIGTLTLPPREFNLMFQTSIGAMSAEAAQKIKLNDENDKKNNSALQSYNASVAYLRPETAQGIFVNFHNILRTSRMKAIIIIIIIIYMYIFFNHVYGDNFFELFRFHLE